MHIYVDVGTDCDDSDSTIGSGDLDEDGYDSCDVLNPNDCDDTDPNINPSVDVDEDGYDACADCDDSNLDINAGC